MKGFGKKIRACFRILFSRKFVYSVERKDHRCVYGWYFENPHSHNIKEKEAILRSRRKTLSSMALRLRKHIDKVEQIEQG